MWNRNAGNVTDGMQADDPILAYAGAKANYLFCLAIYLPIKICVLVLIWRACFPESILHGRSFSFEDFLFFAYCLMTIVKTEFGASLLIPSRPNMEVK